MSTRDEVVHLTSTERRLLDCLVRNAGQVVSRKELLEAIGHPNSRRDRNVLRQNITWLRKKIEIDPALPRVIITHHRQGYSFAGKEEAKRVIEERLRQDREDKDRLIRDVEEWLEEQK